MSVNKMTYREKARKCPVDNCDGEFVHEHTDKPNIGDYANYMTCGHDLDDLCIAGNAMRERIAELEGKTS